MNRNVCPAQVSGCCEAVHVRARPSDRSAVAIVRPSRTGLRILRMLPSVTAALALLLLPKCPACLLAYAAVGAGIAVSTSAAEHLRDGFVVLCLLLLLYGASRTVLKVSP